MASDPDLGDPRRVGREDSGSGVKTGVEEASEKRWIAELIWLGRSW